MLELMTAWLADLTGSVLPILVLSAAVAGVMWLAMLAARARIAFTRLFLYLALGGLALCSGVWFYLAFQAAYREPPGSYRIRGVVFAERVAPQWGFHRLHGLIESRWLYLYPRMDTIPTPSQARERMSEGVLRAEAFRSELLAEEAFAARLITRAILAFHEAMVEQPDVASLSEFIMDEDSLFKSIAGGNEAEYAEASFEAFRGRWHGEWDGMEVDHHWSRVERYDPPDRLSEPTMDVDVTALQYAWIGDGIGWNAVILTERGRAILGAVYHVEDGDPERVYLYRPHVGIALDSHRLIWITEGEIFLEEVVLDDERPHYKITGFHYTIENGALVNRENAFQAIYTRDPEDRPAFRRFPLHLSVE